MLRYPTDAPLDAVSSLVAIVKSQNIAGQKEQFALALWNVQGYIQGKALGEGPLVVGCLGGSTCSDEEAIAAATAIESQLNVAEGAQAAIPWTLLLPLVKYGLQALLAIL